MPKDEPKQRTQPKEGEPVEIPVPKRDDVLRVFDRAAQPLPKKRKQRKK